MGESASALFVDASSAQPIQLSGPPLHLVGRVRLRNPHSVSFVLRDLGISDRSGRLVDMPTRHTLGPVVLRPATERVVPLAIALDRVTAPGKYDVELNVTGRAYPAVLNIAESIALRVEPKRLIVMNEPDRPQRMQLIVRNEGNVTLTIPDIGSVDLRDDVTEVRDLRGVVGPMLDEVPKNLDDVVAVFFAILRPRGPAVGCLSVRVLGGPVHLRPGSTSEVDLEIVVAAGLAANGRYRGRAAVQTADLEFMVMPTALPTHGAPAHTNESASASRTKRPAGRSSRKRK